jgi:predicted DNA-binding protein (MmcQ/YjbR family)
MTRQDLIKMCLAIGDAYEDYPFNKRQSKILWTAMRHKRNRKIFALIYEKDLQLHINLKCDADNSEKLRFFKESVHPGYHMSKRHWITVVVNGDLSRTALKALIRYSHALTSGQKVAPRDMLAEILE